MQNEIVTTLASTAVGGGAVAIVAKLMIQSWFKQHEKMLENVQNIAVEMARMQATIESFRQADQTIRNQDRILTVLNHRLDRIDTDIKALDEDIKEIRDRPETRNNSGH